MKALLPLLLYSLRPQSIQTSFTWIATLAITLGEMSLAIAADPPKPVVRKTPPPAVATPSPKRRSIWSALLDLLKRQEPPLASRSAICPILPGLLGPRNVIWSDRPLFAWQGQIQTLEVRPYSSTIAYEDQPILWQRSVVGEMIARYDGIPLQRSQTYDWQLMDVQGNMQRYTFQVMDRPEAEAITRDLQALEQRLQASGNSPEVIASAHIQAFMDRDLLSDALQEAYLKADGLPMPERSTLWHEANETLCS